MGTLYTGMGLATMLFPRAVVKYTITPGYLDDASPGVLLLVSVFGAQATCCGLLLHTATLTKRTYKYFGMAMIPFLVFDVYYYLDGAINAYGAIGDGIGNIIFIWCCYLGYISSK